MKMTGYERRKQVEQLRASNALKAKLYGFRNTLLAVIKSKEKHEQIYVKRKDN